MNSQDEVTSTLLANPSASSIEKIVKTVVLVEKDYLGGRIPTEIKLELSSSRKIH